MGTDPVDGGPTTESREELRVGLPPGVESATLSETVTETATTETVTETPASVEKTETSETSEKTVMEQPKPGDRRQ